MIDISIARAGEGALQAPLMDSMFRLRTEVFSERLGWDVRVEHGREHDWFDLIGPRYLVAHTLEALPRALACCRLLPSTGPNMLRDVFPELLDGRQAPSAPEVLEVSRFAVTAACTEPGMGFSEVPAAMVAATLQQSAGLGARALVGVTSAAFERMLLGMGLELARLGRPRRIGKVMSLAFSLPLNASNLRAASSFALQPALGRAA